jgi:hypothetical protein
MATVIVVRDLTKTCQAAPSAWEGRVGERGSIAIRYRWGGLTVYVSYESDYPWDGELVYEGLLGDDPGERTGNSCCSEEEMKATLADLCLFE